MKKFVSAFEPVNYSISCLVTKIQIQDTPGGGTILPIPKVNGIAVNPSETQQRKCAPKPAFKVFLIGIN